MKKLIAILLSAMLMFSSVSALAVSEEALEETSISYIQQAEEDKQPSFFEKCFITIKHFIIFCFGGGAPDNGPNSSEGTSPENTPSEPESSTPEESQPSEESTPPEPDTEGSDPVDPTPPESDNESSTSSDPSSNPESNPEEPTPPEDLAPPVSSTPDTSVPDSSAPDSGDQDEPSDDQLTQYANEVVRLVNEQRAQNGLKALTVDINVQKAAQVRAKEQQQLFSHTRPNGTNCFTALKENGVSYRGAGENIAMGQRSPEQVMNGWMNSEGHRKNILNAKFTNIGVGVHKDSNGKYYWTQMFTY